MTLNEIINAVSAGYYEPQRFLSYWCPEAQCVHADIENGDALIPVILNELAETYDAEASDEQQVAAAVEAIEAINSDLAGCIESLKILQVQKHE